MKSDYSFLSSTITLNDAISFSKQNNFLYASLIDNNLSGAIYFYDLCLQNNINPIIGVELNVSYNDMLYPLNFIALNENGFKNISILSSLASRHKINYLTIDDLKLYNQDVALVISSEDSYLTYCLKNNNHLVANQYLITLKNIFFHCYLGIYRYRNCNDQLINLIKNIAFENNIISIAMQYAIHKNEKDTIILNLLDCLKNNIPANKDFLDNSSICEAYLKDSQNLKIYYDNDELNNLMNFAKGVSLKIGKINFSLPLVYPNDNPNEKLIELAKEGLKNKNLESDIYLKRLNYELKIIIEMGFANYYLVVSDYVNYAKQNKIPVGPARGSGAASLVAYLLNITTIDPLKYDLLFERFLNPSRSNYPDFDIDFADNKRDEIIKYVKEKYGYKKMAYIATFATFGPKSAIRDLARILKISNDDVDYLMKTISNNIISIQNEYKTNPRFKSLLDIHSNYKTLCTLASEIEGLKKQIGLHAAGIILSQENLDELVPTFQIDDSTIALQYDHIVAEKIGLVKMDFLGLKNLSIIDYCLKQINEKYQQNYTLDNLNFDYRQTYDLISSNSNIGIFQLESKGMNEVISKLKPSKFEDIVALIALYRPGPMDMIDTYIKRKNKQEYYQIEPLIEDILCPTYGIIIYQEQIMQICQKIANYSLGDADVFRRAISKKKINLLTNEKQKFVNGCLQNGISENKALEIFNLILQFASYGFNKAHSVGYAKIVSIMAYLKATYPAIFYEALLNVNQENLERRKLIYYEALRLNVKFLKPNVLASSLEFKAINNNILFGLKNIATIKENIAKIIIFEREKCEFKDIYDFIIRMCLNDVSVEIISDLIYAGALDCFNIKRGLLISNLNKLYDFAIMFKGFDYIPNTYDDEKYNFISKPILFASENTIDFIKKEHDMLGIYVTTSPLKKIKENVKEKITEIININASGYYNILGKITLIEIKKTKENKEYLNINIEDDSKILNLKTYQNINNYLEFNKDDYVIANISLKNNRYYLNSLRKLKEIAL